VDATTAIVAVGNGNLDWDNKAASMIKGTGAVLVGITIGENDEAHYSGELAEYVLLSADGGFVANAANNGGYLAALDSDTTSMGKVFQAGTYLNAEGGTTAYLIGNYSATSLQIAGGTLVVTGDLGSSTGKVETIDTNTPLNIYGNLFGGTVATASTADIITNAGTVTVYKDADINSGVITNELVLKGKGDFGTVSVAGTLTVTGDATFTGDASFTAPLNVSPGKATFNADVEFDAADISIADAEFAGNVTVTATAEQTTATAAKFTGASPTLTGNLSAPVVTFNSSGNLTVTGGSLSTGSGLTLGTDLGSIVLGKEGGIEFTGQGKLAGGKYEVSGAGSLLNTADSAGTTVTFAATGITNSSSNANSAPTIVFGNKANLIYTDSAEINGFNLNIATGGSISINGANKELKLTGGGSITAKTVIGSLGAGSLFVVTNAAGSLVAGTNIHGSDEIIEAGSYGTFTVDENFIHSGIPFVKSGTEAAFGITESITPDGDSGAGAGSVAVFTLNTHE
jgi:hypothetical protein